MKHATTMTERHDAAGTESVPGFAVQTCIWIALVAIGVCGRLWQPGWNVTPMAGVALAAGAVFPNPLVAASVPLVSLALGNLVLPGYGSLVMAAVVYAATAWPVLLGRLVVISDGPRSVRWVAAAGSALASSLAFFVTTNLVHWWLSSDYPHTAAGLVACYVAALPFYRWMPVGDVAWTAVIIAVMSAVIAALRTSRGTVAA
ncbi:MAG: DUF6580 family putative transport protein [Planctomycetia bacterium]